MKSWGFMLATVALVSATSVYADCPAALAVCDDATRAYMQCLGDNGLSGPIVCAPIGDAKVSACAQADYTCRNGVAVGDKDVSEKLKMVFHNNSDAIAHEMARRNAADIASKARDANR